MARLTEEEKSSREHDRLMHTLVCKGLTRYLAQDVATVFQKMIRAEAGAAPEGYYPAIRRGSIAPIYRCVGECVCVTCGDVLPWSSPRGLKTKQLHTGHSFGRNVSVRFEESGVAPQCNYCNDPKRGGGMPREFRQWLLEVRGPDVIERLERLKHTPKSFTRDAAVGMRIEFSRRLKAAIASMKGST